MKLQHILLVMLCLSIGYTAEAQLLKKLKQKAQEAAERSLLNKTDEVVSDKTDQALDSLITPNNNKSGQLEEQNQGGFLSKVLEAKNMGQGANSGTNPMDMLGDPVPAPPDNNVQLPDSYEFSYLATMQVKSKMGSKEIQYHLQPDVTYYAQKSTDKNFAEYVVYDIQRQIKVFFVEIEGTKIVARQRMDFMTKVAIMGAYKGSPNTQVAELGSKKLLGYNCSGYEITNDAGTTLLWVTNEAPATPFSSLFNSRSEMPNSPFTTNTMIMKFEFNAAENPDKSYEMVCTALKPASLAFNKSDYIE